jgi:hypothetical protein
MLAQRRSITLNGRSIERTPLLVPSFSSKGFPEVGDIIEYCSELIDNVMLVSAYDLHYEKIKPPFDFASLIFLDSGGYEASKDAELSDYGDKEHFPKEWSREFYEAQIAAWKTGPSTTSVIVSYDHPKERFYIRAQIDRASEMAAGRTDVLREILLKPETVEQTRLQIEPIIKNVHRLADFDIIGMTEKELGNSIRERMTNIARIRRALTAAGLETPIHIFGSLDTVTTPMYFLAGADIFDGLTWLRFVFHNGYTIYKQNYSALELGIRTSTSVVDAKCWHQNYYYISQLEDEMRRFLLRNEFSSFRCHSEKLEMAYESILEAEG